MFENLKNALGFGGKNFNVFSSFTDMPAKQVGSPVYTKVRTPLERLNAMLANPAMMKVVALQTTVFSLCKFYLYDQEGKEVKIPAFDRLVNKPSDRKTKSSFLKEVMFWYMYGDCWIYLDRENLDKSNFIKVLMTPALDFPLDFGKKLLKVKQDADYMKGQPETIRYLYDGINFESLRFNRMHHISDMNFIDGITSVSRVDALYKFLSNVNHTLDSKNINTRFSGNFLVGGENDPSDIKKLPFGEEEQRSIVTKINRGDKVQAMKSLAKIMRYVEDMSKLKLDDSFLHDYFFIGSMFGIPKDVLEAFNSGTYENQSTALVRWVETSLQPIADAVAEILSVPLNNEKLTPVASYDHLFFMQKFKKEMDEGKSHITKAFADLKSAGVDIDSINSYLDTNFKEAPKTNENEGSETQPTDGQEAAPN